MNGKTKKFVASYSGGKDSILAIHRAIKQGMEPQALLITYNTDLERSWFHGIPEGLLKRVSQSLHIPIKMIKTSGEKYRENFAKELREEKKKGAEVCVFGDIDIEGHLEWCQSLCREVGIQACFPLWQEDRKELVKEFIKQGYTGNITVVDTSRLSNEHLGKVLTESLVDAIAAEGADACGENGEYHSFVSDGPIFSCPVSFSYGEKVIREKLEILPLRE